MAGMQYYFFPTDFYYPRPQPVTVDGPTCNRLVPHVEVQKLVGKDVDQVEQRASLVHSNVSESKLMKKSLPHSSIGLCHVRFDSKREETSSAIAICSAFSAYDVKDNAI